MKKILITLITLTLLTGCGFFDQSDKQTTTPTVKNETKTTKKKNSLDDCYLYYYEQLSKDEKEIYESIYDCVINHDEKTEVGSSDMETISNITSYVLYDHPEIFYLNYFELQNQVKVCYYIPKYSYTKEETSSLKSQIETVRDNFISSLDQNSSDYDKLKEIYNFVINKCTYVENAKDNQHLTSSLLYGDTVCSGYVKAVQYLCQAVDIKCSYIVGKALDDSQDINHAWNLIYLDNDYYYLDATWGDYVDQNDSFAMYAYFMFDSNDMLKLYQPISKYHDTKSGEYCYFNHEGLYNNSYNLNELKKQVSLYRNNNIEWMEFKFDDASYQSAKNRLINQQEMFDLYSSYTTGSYSVQYLYLDTLNVLIFKLL